MNINTLDLNLLRVFHAVMREGSITLAGGSIGLTQSATSNALKRLRAQCGDPLFVRTADGMVPTQLASELAPPIAQALALLKDAVARERGFDPARSRRDFRMLMTDVGDLMFLPRLTSHLRGVAPGVRLICRELPREQHGLVLERGEADIALGMLPPGPRDFVQQRLFDEPLVCIVGRDHPVIRGSLSRAQYLAAEHVVRQPRGLADSMVVSALGSSAAQRKVVLEVQHYMVVPQVVQSTALLSIVPETIATAVQQAALQIFRPPFPVRRLVIHQYWHKRQHADAGHRWLRAEIARLFSRRND